jgi:uncharacterized protein (DUF849 family)
VSRAGGELVITCAITGGDTVPSQSDALPISPEQIVAAAVEAREAGASVVHVHAREADGRPSADPDTLATIVSGIRAQTDLIVNLTTGGGAGMTYAERVAPIAVTKPEIGTFNLGSFDFWLFPAAGKIDRYRHAWERTHLESTKSYIFENTFTHMEQLAALYAGTGTAPEFEAYDVSHLYNLAFLLRRGLVEAPIRLQFVLGVLGAMWGDVRDLIYMRDTAARLFGDAPLIWSVAGIGYPREFHLGAVAMIMGGNVRVGLEDNVRISLNTAAGGNGELVAKAVRLAHELDRVPVGPARARELLMLGGEGG